MPSGENSTVVVLSDEAELYNKQLEAVYRDWEPRADRSGRRSLWMQSRLAERHNEFDGESFTVMSDVGRIDKPIPLALQVIDPERVNTPAEFAGDPLVRLGIRYTADGDIVGYYVQRSHPGDTKNFKLSYEFVEADRMLHVFEPWFAEQSRGLPWMTRALNRARDAKDVDEAAILGMQIEQCYAGFVESGEVPDPFASAATTAVSASGKPLQDIVPGTIRYLEKGQKVHFGSPTRPGNAFAPFQEWNYRRVAAAINWPYEMVVKNWGTLSFSAGRLVLTDAKKATQVGQKIMREMWLCRVWNRMVYESVVVGETDIDPRLYLQFPNVFERHVWIPPKWEYALNPGEEIDADIKEIDANLATLEDMLGKRGYDLEDLLARKKRERQLIKAAGLDEAPQAPKTPFGKPPAKKPVDADEADAESEEREVAA
jgi:lambda family phage portal protein